MQRTRFASLLSRTAATRQGLMQQHGWMTPMTRPTVLHQRSLASLTNDQPPPSVRVTKHPESPEVAIMTLSQRAFSHDIARLMIKVPHYRHTAIKTTLADSFQDRWFNFQVNRWRLTDRSTMLNCFSLLNRNGRQWSKTSQFVQ